MYMAPEVMNSNSYNEKARRFSAPSEILNPPGSCALPSVPLAACTTVVHGFNPVFEGGDCHCPCSTSSHSPRY